MRRLPLPFKGLRVFVALIVVQGGRNGLHYSHLKSGPARSPSALAWSILVLPLPSGLLLLVICAYNTPANRENGNLDLTVLLGKHLTLSNLPKVGDKLSRAAHLRHGRRCARLAELWQSRSRMVRNQN